MDVGISYRQVKLDERWDAIVIGSGMSGLTTAAILAKHARKRVLVLEQHYTAGGFTHTFTRPGYEWDVGVHYIGQVGPRGQLRRFYDYLTDGRLDWAPMPDVYDRIYLGDRAYDYVAGTKRFVARMKEYFPGEERAIEAYVTEVKAAARAGMMFGLEKALPASVARVAGGLMRRPLLRHAERTTGEVLAAITDNRELRAVLAGQLGDYGLPPSRSSFAMHASVAAHYMSGAFFPVGGAGAIARGIAPVIERQGGVIAVRAEVEQILVERRRAVGVRMTDGRELRAPIVVSTAGAVNTLEHLLPEAHRPAALRREVARVGTSVGYVSMYLGFEHTDAELGLEGTNLWLYPDADHDGNFARFEADPEAPLPLVFVSFPSAKDPTWKDRHPGRATVDLIAPARYEWFAKWEGTRWKKRGAEYDQLKARFGERMLDALSAKVPHLRDKIAIREVSTPLSTQHFAGSTRGELYGLDHGPSRYDLAIRAATHLGGLYLSGQDMISCGVSAALFGGVLTATAIAGPGVLLAISSGR